MIAYVIAAMILGVYFAFSSGRSTASSTTLWLRKPARTSCMRGGSAGFVPWRAPPSWSARSPGSARAIHLGPLHLFRHYPAHRAGDHRVLTLRRAAAAQARRAETLRSHIALTLKTMITSRAVLRVLLLVATAGLLSQAVFEFGPLWLVALAAPAVLYGPYWAVLVSTLGIGGLLIAKLNLERWLMVAVLIIGSLATALVLTWTRALPVVIAAQVVLALVLALLGIHASRLLHDAVPSSIRAGVSSGAGTLTWVLFLPFSLVFGWTARDNGIGSSGFMLAGAVVILAALLILSVRASRGIAPVEVAATAKQEAVQVTQQAEEMACKQLVELVADYLDDALSPQLKARFEQHLAGCDGCSPI